MSQLVYQEVHQPSGFGSCIGRAGAVRKPSGVYHLVKQSKKLADYRGWYNDIAYIMAI